MLFRSAGYDLLDVVDQIPDDQVFLGMDHYGRVLGCDPEKDLCHGALNAITGRGKTILVRGLETQLLAMGCEVVHADIKFSLSDESKNDYRPIARALLAEEQINMNGMYLPHLLLREDHICHMLEWLAGPELQRRLAMYAQGDHSYGVFFLFLEELAYLITKYKELGKLIGTILVVGRSLGIKVMAVAQNFQVQNLKINSGMRENFESAWYLGGDMDSGASVLDLSEADLKMILSQHNIQLGKGVSLFRNNMVAFDPVVLRTGMASNEFVYHFLGRADGFLLPEYLLPDPGEQGARPQRSGNRRVVSPGWRAKDEEMPAFETFRVSGQMVDGSVASERVSGGFGRSGIEQPHEGEQARPSAFQGASQPENGTFQSGNMRDGAREQNGVTGPVETAGDPPNVRPMYALMTEGQIERFKVLYPVLGKERALDEIPGCNHRHRKHAQEIIEQFGLKRREAK